MCIEPFHNMYTVLVSPAYIYLFMPPFLGKDLQSLSVLLVYISLLTDQNVIISPCNFKNLSNFQTGLSLLLWCCFDCHPSAFFQDSCNLLKP